MITVLDHPLTWAVFLVVLFAVVDYFRRRYENGRPADLPEYAPPLIEPGPRTRRSIERPDPRVVAYMRRGDCADEAVERVFREGVR